MAYLPHTHIALKYPPPPLKRRRRTATAVLAGAFDFRPRVDVLTSVLNGVKPYRPPMSEEELKQKEAEREKRKAQHQRLVEERERKKKEKQEKKEQENTRLAESAKVNTVDQKNTRANGATDSHQDSYAGNSFWKALPPRLSVDILESTPEPSDDGSSSRSSSKRPHTPIDDPMGERPFSASYSPVQKSRQAPSPPPPRKVGRPPKKRRITKTEFSDVEEVGSPKSAIPRESKKARAARKGWKGWVEASEDELPKDKLIELDQAIVLQDRRTRSGKNFDAY